MDVEAAGGVATEFEMLVEDRPEVIDYLSPTRVGLDDWTDNFYRVYGHISKVVRLTEEKWR